MALADIETIVFLMLENRSFDHVLGYLSTTSSTPPIHVEGIRSAPEWLEAHVNIYGATRAVPHLLNPSRQQFDDPPHDHAAIALQIGVPQSSASPLPMDGFLASYMTRQPPPIDPTGIMGYYDAATVPVFDFLARNFAVCDQWFAALPCGTQPNRLMAMSGSSPILDNAEVALPDHELVYDWLTRNGVSWCAYQSGDYFPFFSLMPSWLPEIVTSLALSSLGGRGRFRRYSQFAEHWGGTAAMPNVIFIEPEYTDGPHGSPNDDHPPSGIAKGQALVGNLYTTLISNPARWRNTLLIVTYDEHGGFYDHIPPLQIAATTGGVSIATTGVRVPALLVSPHIEPGIPFHDLLDHTSFLQLLAERFTPGTGYSPEIASRQTQLGRLSTALTNDLQDCRVLPLPQSTLDAIMAMLASSPASVGHGDSDGAAKTTAAFHSTAMAVARDHPDMLTGPGWSKLANYVLNFA